MGPSQLDQFWKTVIYEVSDIKATPRLHDFPMARIKKIMKMDESVQSCVRSVGH